jgi:septum formation protein
MSTDYVYLASASPRRRDLLRQIGVEHRLLGVEVDEAVIAGEAPEGYVRRLAAAKARCGWEGLAAAGAESAPVLGADTAVVLDGRIIGKPRDRADALTILGGLSGRTHEVLTAVALCDATVERAALSRSRVSFRALSADECARYWDTGEPRDKAGAYAIQGLAAVFVTDLAGSYSGVMGLPLFETAQLLAQAGVARWCSR